jgi:hypothetical protein
VLRIAGDGELEQLEQLEQLAEALVVPAAA